MTATPLLAAYIAKQEIIAAKLPAPVQTLFPLAVADFRNGKRIGAASFADFRLTKTRNLVDHLGMDLEQAREINQADMAEYQAAFAEYQAANPA